MRFAAALAAGFTGVLTLAFGALLGALFAEDGVVCAGSSCISDGSRPWKLLDRDDDACFVDVTDTASPVVAVDAVPEPVSARAAEPTAAADATEHATNAGT
jgi:hypothetical protein